MGFEERDYYREEDQGGFLGPRGIGDACKALIAINVAVFLVEILTIRGIEFTSLIWLDPNAVLHGQVWRLATWGFGYDGGPSVPLNFLFDMLFIWWFGRTIESLYGSRELALFYAASVLLAGTACVLSGLAGRGSILAGADLPVMAITVLFAWHFPRQKLLLFFVLPVEIWLVVTLFAGYNLFLYATTGGAGAFAAGLTVVAFALAYGKCGWKIGNLIPAGRPTLRVPKRKPKLRVFDPVPTEDLDARVDEILQKIHEHGEASLSDRERRTLEEASKRYRKS